MKIYLVFLLATTVICRPHNENRQPYADPGIQFVNDIEGIVYLDGSSAHANRIIRRSPYIGKDQAVTGNPSDLNNYASVRRYADSTTSAIKPIDQLPESLRISDKSYEKERNFEGPREVGTAEYAERSSNIDQETNHFNFVRRYGQENPLANKVDTRYLGLKVPVLRQDTLFTGIDGMSQGSHPKTASHLENVKRAMRAGYGAISQAYKQERPKLNNQNNTATKGSSLAIIPAFDKNTKSGSKTSSNAKIASHAMHDAYGGSPNRSRTDMKPKGRGILNMFGFNIPFPKLSENNKFIASACHCVNINGHRSCTCDHKHNCDTNCKGLAETPTDNFSHFTNIFKGVTEAPSFNYFDSIFKGVTEPPKSKYSHIMSYFNGVTQAPTAKFGHIETIFKAVHEPSHYTSIYKEHTTPVPIKIITKPMKIHHPVKEYPSNQHNCNCGCGCCSCGCNFHNDNHDNHKESYYNEDVEDNENDGGFEDASNYPNEDTADFPNEETGHPMPIHGSQVHSMTQTAGWKGMFDGSGGILPYVPGSPHGEVNPNIDVNSSEESKDFLDVDNTDYSSGGFIPKETGAILKKNYGGEPVSDSIGEGHGHLKSIFGSGGFKHYIKSLFAKDAV